MSVGELALVTSVWTAIAGLRPACSCPAPLGRDGNSIRKTSPRAICQSSIASKLASASSLRASQASNSAARCGSMGEITEGADGK